MSSTGHFLSLLMHSRTRAHVYHLDTNPNTFWNSI